MKFNIRSIKEENRINLLKKDFQEFILNNNSSEEEFLVKIKIKANKLNPEKHTNIENIQKEIIIKLLNTDNIINNSQKVMRIVVISDYYSVHNVGLVIEVCKLFNIKLVPVDSPHLNPINKSGNQ